MVGAKGEAVVGATGVEVEVVKVKGVDVVNKRLRSRRARSQRSPSGLLRVKTPMRAVKVVCSYVHSFCMYTMLMRLASRCQYADLCVDQEGWKCSRSSQGNGGDVP